MRPYAVDANAINLFQQERLKENMAEAHGAISKIFEKDCIALDSNGHCLQEWLDCAGGKVPFALQDWVADQMIIGKIRNFPLCAETFYRDLLEVGLPKKDHKWVRLAVGSKGNIIVSEDIDFLDPSKKKASEREKARIRESATGPCSKYLMKKHGVEVVCIRKLSG